MSRTADEGTAAAPWRPPFMSTHLWPSHARHEEGTRWLVTGFIAGAIAVLVFHQGAIAMLHAAGMTDATPYSMTRTAPLGLPAVWSSAFWGGAWGVVLAVALRRLDGPTLIVSSIVFGAILPTLVAWFIVAPLKGRAMAAGFAPAAMMVGVIANGSWGLGTGAGLLLFGRSHARGITRSI